MEYISTQEAAKKWDVSLRYVQRLLRDGRIPGAKKYGVSWMLPANSKKPSDPRQKQPKAAVQHSSCSFFPILYIRGGNIEAAMERCKSDEERTLLGAQLAYFRCDPYRAMELAQQLYCNTSETILKLGCGFVIAIAAVAMGDAQTWAKTFSELQALPLLKSQQSERELALAMLSSSIHGKSACPAWLKKGDFAGLPPELFPLARYIYVKNIYINWKEIDLIAVAEPLISECHREKNDLAEVYLRIIAAVAYHDLGRNAEARPHLEAAADIAEPIGMISPFAEHQHTLTKLTERCLKESHPNMLSAIREVSKSYWDNWARVYNDIWDRPMVSGLTSRELEAARLAQRGMTTKEIAARMGISQGSVKKYLNVAYSKLGIDKKSDLHRLIHT